MFSSCLNPFYLFHKCLFWWQILSVSVDWDKYTSRYICEATSREDQLSQGWGWRQRELGDDAGRDTQPILLWVALPNRLGDQGGARGQGGGNPAAQASTVPSAHQDGSCSGHHTNPAIKEWNPKSLLLWLERNMSHVGLVFHLSWVVLRRQMVEVGRGQASLEEADYWAPAAEGYTWPPVPPSHPASYPWWEG